MDNLKNDVDNSVYRFGRVVSVITIVLFVILAISLNLLEFGRSAIFEPPGLLPLLNLFFLFICPMIVGCLAAKGYLETGSISLITLGGGVFSLGLGSLIAGFLLQAKGPNAVITIHNISVCLSGVFHFTGAAMALAGFKPEQDARKRKYIIVTVLTGIFAFLVILTLGELQGVLPIFFVQGQGPTVLRQVILGFAVLSFFISGILFMKLYGDSRSNFLCWYTAALILISIGLGCIFIQKSFGSPIGWLGRIAQYIAGLYMAAAVFAGAKESGIKVTRFDKILESFFHNRFEFLLAERTDELALANDQLRREIDERKLAEDALRKSEVLKNTIIESSPDCIKLLDLEGNLTFMSKGGQESLEIKDITVYLNKNWTDFWQGQDNIKARMAVDAAVKGTIGDFQGYSPTETGIPHWWDVLIVPIRDSNGEVEQLLAVSRNITKQKQMGAQLQQSQKMEAVGTLAGGIAHDFNNILAVILGNAELASDDIPDWNPASNSLREIHRASIRAKDMVKQLLAFSRKSGEESKPLALDIAPILKESMKMLRHAIPTSVEFKLLISDASYNVMCDAAQINQIVMNLVTNAADAMSEKEGLLEVTLEHIIFQKEKACFEQVLSPGPYVRLRMRDTGEGIDPTIMDRIFDPYYTTKEVGKGTGMGLSVVHGIVKRHGGGIRVESDLGKGTIFEIYFPALEKTAEKEKEPGGEIRGGSEKVLFVDDEESMVNLNRQRLERLGYDVKSTTKPLEALEWFKADPDQFDVILTDMTMPQMTGDRLTAEVMKIRPDMPVIICTGYSERMSAKKAETLGVRKYIEKPIELQQLASSLREILDEK